MQGYKQAHTNLRIWGCRDARKGIWTWRSENVRMWGHKQVHTDIRIWGCEDARIQATAQEPKDMVMWECEDIKQIYQICRLFLESMRGYKQVHTDIRIWGFEDTRIRASAQKPMDMRMWWCEDINQSNTSNIQVTSRLHTSLYT